MEPMRAGRRRRSQFIEFIGPLFVMFVAFGWFLAAPESFMESITPIMIVFVSVAFLTTFGSYFYRKWYNQNLRKQNICPYCKKQNEEGVKNCIYCQFPMNEDYN